MAIIDPVYECFWPAKSVIGPASIYRGREANSGCFIDPLLAIMPLLLIPPLNPATGRINNTALLN